MGVATKFKMGQHSPERYTFRYKPGARHKVSAEVVGKVCSELDDKDMLTPENLLDASRPNDAPVHNEFEWNDGVAAEKYRVSQAAALIRHVIVYEKPEEKPDEKRDDEAPKHVVTVNYGDVNGCRAFGSLHVPGGGKERYVATHKMLDDAEMRNILLDNARRELNSFVCKYRQLEGLAGLLRETADNLMDRLPAFEPQSDDD